MYVKVFLLNHAMPYGITDVLGMVPINVEDGYKAENIHLSSLQRIEAYAEELASALVQQHF